MSLDQLVESIPVVLYEAVPGPDGAWLYVSPHVEALLGYTPEEWMADPSLFVRALHPDDRADVLRIEAREMEAASEPGVAAVSEYRMLHRDGRVVWVRDQACLAGGGANRVWRGVLIDISAERVLSESLDRYRTLVEGLSICLYSSDPGPDGRWRFLSPQIVDLVGYEAGELMADVGLRLALVHTADLDEVLAEETRLLGSPPGTRAVREYRLVHRDGSVLRVRDRSTVARGADGTPRLDGMLGRIAVETDHAGAQGLPDVYRVVCSRCGHAWAATEIGACEACGSTEVDATSLETTLRDLAAANAQVEGLLDAIHRHLDTLQSSLHGEPALLAATSRQVMTPLAASASSAAAGALTSRGS